MLESYADIYEAACEQCAIAMVFCSSTVALQKGLEYIREIPEFVAVQVLVMFPQFSRDVFSIPAYGT